MADEFKSVRVTKAWDEGPRLRALLLDLSGTGFAERFTTPGQYVKVRTPGAARDAFMAIASAPGKNEIELLVQASGAPEPSTADLVARAKTGDPLEVTAPGGKGFAIASASGLDVIAIAGGSGISAIRSVIEHIALHRQRFGRASLLIGARTVDDLAYRALFGEWNRASIDVDAALSRPHPGSWAGRVGYVTTPLKEMRFDPARTWVAVAGGKPFVTAVTEALTGMGLAPERISKNF